MFSEQKSRGKIYFRSSEPQIRIEEILEYLNLRSDSEIRFQKTSLIQEAEYAVLIIGKGNAEKLPSVEESEQLLTMQQCIFLVEKVLFEEYESYRKKEAGPGSPVYRVIRFFNENRENRRWIYTYTSAGEISSMIGKIILSEYFSINFSKAKVHVKPGECFENTVTFKNTGYTRLNGYFIDGLFIHNTGKHRPRLENFNPIIKATKPHEEIHIKMDFKAPDIAGSFAFYLIVKKRGLILNMDDAVRKFVLHVASEDEPSYDAVLLEESPPNGILFTDKKDFIKTWRLRNTSGENWRKILFKVKFESATHYFCKERKKVYYDIPDGSEFTISANLYSPDIPGKYTVYYQLLREDRTEIITDGPICCSVVTQYERQSQFEVI